MHKAEMIYLDVDRDGTSRVLTLGCVGIVAQLSYVYARQVFTTDMVVTSVSHGRKIIRQIPKGGWP